MFINQSRNKILQSLNIQRGKLAFKTCFKFKIYNKPILWNNKKLKFLFLNFQNSKMRNKTRVRKDVRGDCTTEK